MIPVATPEISKLPLSVTVPPVLIVKPQLSGTPADVIVAVDDITIVAVVPVVVTAEHNVKSPCKLTVDVVNERVTGSVLDAKEIGPRLYAAGVIVLPELNPASSMIIES